MLEDTPKCPSDYVDMKPWASSWLAEDDHSHAYLVVLKKAGITGLVPRRVSQNLEIGGLDSGLWTRPGMQAVDYGH